MNDHQLEEQEIEPLRVRLPIAGELTHQRVGEIAEALSSALSQKVEIVEPSHPSWPQRADFVVENEAGEPIMLVEVKAGSPPIERLDKVRERLGIIRERNHRTAERVERLRERLAAS